ncbi:hypothetical protein L6164_023529 [Bauhinia variegata]|uniref:Uncharacterized protein n=1 Tax=Bauhinia variegata TaxID=167791 RepID=A0ACB9MKE8_BAUVA|nr:hypothetical protein L6164_023529 [Bauhinia variegata]
MIHRDVKTANILLDETYTAKVSDFGASRLVLMDHAEIATVVQGTIGYLDPEYMQTSEFTEKSDVYSFEVVLVELLTGEKVVSFDRPQGKRSLAMHFLSSFKQHCLFEVIESGIVNEENKQEVMEVAVLASKSLNLIGNIELNLEETESLLQEKSRIYERSDSSNHQNIGYDSIKDHVLIAFDDGR